MQTLIGEKFDGRVKKWFPLKNANLTVKLKDVKVVDDYDKAKSVNTMPSLFGTYILSFSRRLMNDVIKQIGGIYNQSIYYSGTDFLYIHKQYWST